MNCSRVAEYLALVAGGDRQEGGRVEVRLHLEQCPDCRQLSERLSASLGLLRSLRQDAVPSSAAAQMRRGLMTRLESGEARLGLWLRLERFLVMQLRRPRYAVAGAAIAVMICGTLFTQLSHVAANPDATASVMSAQDAMSRPEDYRDWVFLGTSTTHNHSGEAPYSQNVYIQPEAYREYRRSGHFPAGTVMVLESAKESEKVAALSVSVKDSRFGGGWGFFRFEERDGQVPEKAGALPDAEGCMSCHHAHGATDHVFTQFYPVLRATSGVL